LGERPSVDINNVDALFNQEAINSGVFEIVTNRGRGGNFGALAADTYDGRRTIHAGFVNATYDLTSKLTVDGGLRIENMSQDVTWDFNQDRRRFFGDNLTSISKTYVLPSLNARYQLDDDNIIRLAASQTYTMPQFKEVAPFLYEDIDFSSFGNPNLIPSDVYNLDIKFDHYFSRGELISVTGFYKQVKNSINRVLVESAATEMSYVNSGDADVVGMEFELRKTVWNISPEMYLEAGLNTSYLYTKQTLTDSQYDELQPRFTNTTSKLEGASPLLVNADLTLRKEGSGLNITSALVFNSFNDRIYTIGTSGVNDIINVTVPRLDWISKIAISDRVNAGVGVKNLLNPSIEKVSTNSTTGEELLVNSFQRGVEYSFSIGYRIH
jgi:outer membrane receptor protein involved in Fe transport